MTKLCTMCLEEKPLEEFPRKGARCTFCLNVLRREAYQKKKEVICEQKRDRYYANLGENQKRKREYYWSNRDKILQKEKETDLILLSGEGVKQVSTIRCTTRKIKKLFDLLTMISRLGDVLKQEVLTETYLKSTKKKLGVFTKSEKRLVRKQGWSTT